MPVLHPFWAFGLTLVVASGCLFNDPINVPPTIVAINHPEKIWRGAPAQFTVEVTDDQIEAPTIEWARIPGACPAITNDRQQWPTDRVKTTVFTVDASLTRDPFCAWVVAVDRYGAASRPATYDAIPASHPPTARIEVIKPAQGPPYPFLSRFRLSAANSSNVEMDALTFEWALLRQPAGSQAMLVPCLDNPGTDVRCLDSDTKGDYEIEAKVRDAVDLVLASLTLAVLEDKLPCIDVTAPDYASGPDVHTVVTTGDAPGAPSTDDFAVLRVDDDLDPWPGSGDSELHFFWSLARDNGPFVPMGFDLPKIAIPKSTFRIGDKARVRVEVADRNNAKEIQDTLLGCHDEDNCAVTTPDRAFGGRAGCLLRVGWTVEYR